MPHRITDTAADLLDEAILEIGITTEDAGWDLVVVPQSEKGPGVGIFWSEPGAVLGTVVGAFGFVPLPFNKEKALAAVRGLLESIAQARTMQLQQASGVNGNEAGPGLIDPSRN